jgi:hypothetical protein
MLERLRPRWVVENEELATAGRADREGLRRGGDARVRAGCQIQAEIFNAAFGQEARHRVLDRGRPPRSRRPWRSSSAPASCSPSRQAAAAAGELGRRANRPSREATAESGPEVPPVVRPGSDG